MTTSHQRSILKIGKPGEVLIFLLQELNFCPNIWILYRDQVLLALKAEFEDCYRKVNCIKFIHSENLRSALSK